MASKFDDSETLNRYTRIIIIAFAISISLLLFLYSPLNQKTYNLLDNPDIRLSQSGEIREGTIVTRRKNHVSVYCDIKNTEQFAMCGAAFFVPLNLDEKQFVSFSKHAYIAFDVQSDADIPDFDHKTRILIKTLFHEDAWNNYDNSDIKFNAVRFTANGENVIPLEDFKVETWWETLYKIPYEQAKKDFSKIVNVEVHLEDVPIKTPGLYKIEISQLEVIDDILNKNSVFLFFAYFWPVFIFILLLHFIYTKNRQLKIITKKALFDSGTHVLNKNGFLQYYSQYINQKGTLYLIKITNWRTIENHFGPELANQLIKTVNQAIIQHHHLRDCLYARFSKNEMVILTQGRRFDQSVESFLIQALQESRTIQGNAHLRLRVKLAVVEDAPLPEDFKPLLDKAYRTIDSILNTSTSLQIYNCRIHEQAREEIRISNQLIKALATEAFHLVFMPLYDIKNNRISGAEALIRCDLPSMASVYPDTYIPIAEKYGIIRKIDFWVIENAVKTLNKNKEYLDNNFVISINISSRELLDTYFVAYFKSILSDYNVEAKRICLEVTETFFIDINQISYETLDELRRLGCKISLDDFGTGYTSFSHLMNIPIDEIKIDRSFVDKMHLRNHMAVIESILSIAQANEYEVVAEGVEEPRQLHALKNLGCPLYQGYLISKPVPFEEIIEIDTQLKRGLLHFF